MSKMPVRLQKLAAMWVMTAVVSSAMLTCIPGAMSAHARTMPACAAGMHEQGGSLSADLASNCCVRHDPSLIAAKTGLGRVSLYVAPSFELPASAFVPSAPTTHIDTSPAARSSIGPSVYITLSTLRI